MAKLGPGPPPWRVGDWLEGTDVWGGPLRAAEEGAMSDGTEAGEVPAGKAKDVGWDEFFKSRRSGKEAAMTTEGGGRPATSAGGRGRGVRTDFVKDLPGKDGEYARKWMLVTLGGVAKFRFCGMPDDELFAASGRIRTREVVTEPVFGDDAPPPKGAPLSQATREALVKDAVAGLLAQAANWDLWKIAKAVHVGLEGPWFIREAKYANGGGR